MNRFALAVTEFALPVQSDSAPRPVVLERRLARGRRAASGARSWRHWILGQSGFAPPPELPLGSLLARREGPFAVATPVHLLAGLEHVHLDPAGPPALEACEWQQLVDAFNVEFGQDGLRLGHDAGVGVLSLPRNLDVTTHDPRALAGRDAGSWLPQGPDGGWLRRTMTAIEMWLHDHALNRRRESAGRAPVNGLWIWGSGGQSMEAPAGTLPWLATDDVLLRRAWEHFDGRVSPAPGSFDAWLDMQPPAACLALSLSSLDPDPRVALEAFESRWLAPIAAAVGGGRGERAQIYLDGTVLQFSRGDLWRFWRRPRAWHEALR